MATKKKETKEQAPPRYSHFIVGNLGLCKYCGVRPYDLSGECPRPTEADLRYKRTAEDESRIRAEGGRGAYRAHQRRG
jgi:hypothetical protein